MNDLLSKKEKQQWIIDIEREVIDKLNQIHSLMMMLDPTAAHIMVDIDHDDPSDDIEYTISVSSCGNEINTDKNGDFVKTHFKVSYKNKEPVFLINYADIQGEDIRRVRID